ncbi:hypothetical protein HUT18_10620 [Streptomyces sp. NA04227]|uniref:hypothetical protein n=1 Tax=Streptomyces sp. NA04227 TaxID=2742136 RepID=UPI001590EA2F|nr:hypothetical protein [Streptomyces sp. NA04227]QKW06779.1 hypothetical protein HUT18_10620 [Streptomyces sp. NA04227]
MSWLDDLNTGFGVIGFVITVITLIKVQSVHCAQREERALLRRLYGTDSLASHLRSAARFLRQGREDDAHLLAEELVRLCGQIEGISRTLDSMSRSRGGTSGRGAQLVEKGYFVPPFLNRMVNEAQHNLDVVMYRNLQFANVDLLQALERASKRGVHIRVLGLSSVADDSVLEQASMVLPWPRADARTLRRQLADSENRIKDVVEGWSEEARLRFEYRGYTLAPNAHFVRQDRAIFQGFIGTLAPAQPERLEDRGYLELSVATEPGATLARHFDQLWVHSADTVVVGG